MSKYCIECGKELPDEAKFCLGCGAKIELEEDVAKEQVEELQVSTGPAAINLKSAYSMILEVGDFIEKKENIIDKRQCKKLDKELDRAVNLIEEARNIDDKVQIIDSKYTYALTCNGVLSFAYYIGGLLLVSYAKHEGGGATVQRAYKEAQKAFHKAYELGPDAASLYNEALCLYHQIHGSGRHGDKIIGLNGEKVFYNPFLPKKGRKIVYDAFQKVIDLYPNDEQAIEARKMQTQIKL